MRKMLVVAGAILAVSGPGAHEVGATPAGALLTINASPDAIVTGDSVLVWGQLHGSGSTGEKITLHQRIDPASTFTTTATTTTDAAGFYEFSGLGAVASNRSWYVTAAAASSPRSRTVHEAVASALTLSASATSGETNHPLTFSGQVLPTGGHTGEHVLLQKQVGTGDDWKTLGTATVDSSGAFSLVHTFLQPNAFDLRATLAGDTQNAPGSSDPITVLVEQAEKVAFTIETSAPTVVVGTPVTIFGKLAAPGSTRVTLWSRAGGGAFAPASSTKTAADGSYSFAGSPSRNETYQVRTAYGPPARGATAVLFEAVAPAVTLDVSPTSGWSVTLTGTVTPDKAGDAVELESMGTDGHFHVVKTGSVAASSTFQFTATFGASGTKTLRAVVPGDADNVKGASPAVSVTVTVPPVESLPTP